MNRNFTDDAILTCKACGVPFAVRHYLAPFRRSSGEYRVPTYCSPHCQSIDRRRIRKCAICGKEDSRPKSFVETGGRNYCSRACFANGLSEFNVGRGNPRYRGRIVTPDGYVYIKMEEVQARDVPIAQAMVLTCGRISEHRLVAAIREGRPLLPEERVHHINGQPGDNRPENLRLVPSDSKHIKLHHAVYAELRAARLENEQLRARLAALTP